MAGIANRAGAVFAALMTLMTLMVTAAAGEPVGVERLAWLQGCWRIDAPERIVEEQWMAPRGGIMLGTSRTVRGGKLVAHEFVVLRERGDQIAYEVNPSGRATTVFLSTQIGPGSVVFENLQHDFPQRVTYERQGADLLAWIEGPSKGTMQGPMQGPMQEPLRRIEYPYRRVACAGE